MIPIVGGLPRSGSTLLAAMLRQNPQIEVTPTGWMLGLVASLCQAYSANPARTAWKEQDQAKARLHGAVRGAVEGYLAADSVKLTVEKGRGWLHWIETLQAATDGQARLIVPVRDLRGCAASMERAYRANPEQAGYGGGAPMVGQRVSQWMQPQSAPLGRPLAEMRDAMRRGVLDQCLIVRYEDVCSEPMAQLERIYDFLGYAMPPGVHSTDIDEPNREHDAVHGPFGDHELQPGPIREPRGDDKQVIGADVAHHIVAGNGWYYRALYPEVVNHE